MIFSQVFENTIPLMTIAFSDTLLHETVKDILSHNNYVHMTDVQRKTIPYMLKTKDVIVQSQTGTGKTLSFVLPIVSMYYKNTTMYSKGPMTLVISPTRELALQICEVFEMFRITTKCLIGGTEVQDVNIDTKVLVGTPGRLIEIYKQFPDTFSKISFLILDEADRLTSLGFKDNVLDIVSHLGKRICTGLFSATINDEIRSIAKFLLKNPIEIQIEGSAVPVKLSISYTIVECKRKLIELINLTENKKSIVFFATCNQVDFFYEFLYKYKVLHNFYEQEQSTKDDGNRTDFYEYINNNDIDTLWNNVFVEDEHHGSGVRSKDVIRDDVKNKQNASFSDFSKLSIYKIHRKMKQEDRQKVYVDFYSNGHMLLCTDVAARGIDFKNVDLVLHFDIPSDFSNIVHRSGRTARNGSNGTSIIFIMPNERAYIEYMKLKEIAVQEYNIEKNMVACKTEHLKKIMSEKMLDFSVRAFVSYFRYYKEHRLSYIIDYTTLDYDGLADLYMLIKIPGMAELKNVKFKNFPIPINTKSNTNDKTSSISADISKPIKKTTKHNERSLDNDRQSKRKKANKKHKETRKNKR